MSLGFWKNKSFISFLIYFERDRHSCLFPFNLLFFSKRLYCNVTTAVLLGRFKTSWHCQKKSIYLHEKETKQNEVNNKKSWNTQKHSILIECMYNLSKPKSIFTHSEWPRFIFTIYDTITLQRRLLNFFTFGCTGATAQTLTEDWLHCRFMVNNVPSRFCSSSARRLFESIPMLKLLSVSLTA